MVCGKLFADFLFLYVLNLATSGLQILFKVWYIPQKIPCDIWITVYHRQILQNRVAQPPSSFRNKGRGIAMWWGGGRNKCIYVGMYNGGLPHHIPGQTAGRSCSNGAQLASSSTLYCEYVCNYVLSCWYFTSLKGRVSWDCVCETVLDVVKS